MNKQKVKKTRKINVNNYINTNLIFGFIKIQKCFSFIVWDKFNSNDIHIINTACLFLW